MKYLTSLLIVLAFAGVASAQSTYTGPVIINRELGGDEVRPRSDVLTHTLVAYVQNGQLVTTISWGTGANLMDWKENWGQDLTAARSALATGQYETFAAGVTWTEFMAAFIDLDQTTYAHPNLLIIANCKFEAGRFQYRLEVATGRRSPRTDFEPYLMMAGTGYYNPEQEERLLAAGLLIPTRQQRWLMMRSELMNTVVNPDVWAP